MYPQKEHLLNYICKALHITQADLARDLGLNKASVTDWKKRPGAIPAQYCKYLERRLRLTDLPLTCADMRPHDWEKYWPELRRKIKKPLKNAA